jgi:hypothetical protein
MEDRKTDRRAARIRPGTTCGGRRKDLRAGQLRICPASANGLVTCNDPSTLDGSPESDLAISAGLCRGGGIS